MTPDHSASEEPDARDPLTCEKCGGPTKENGRWHPDLGAVYGYELGLGDRADSDATSYASQPSQARVAEQVDREALGERITELEGLLERALVFVPKRHPANYTSEPTLRERIVEALGYEPAQPSQPSVPDELPSTAKESAAASNTEAQDGDVDRPACPTCGSDDPAFLDGRCAFDGYDPDPFHDPPAFADADDDALNSTGPACDARSPQQPDGSTYYCTRDAGHSGIHAAANAQEVVCRWPAPEAEGERDEARADELTEADYELLRDLANASPEASIIDLLVTEHAELLARVNRAPASPQPVASEEDQRIVRRMADYEDLRAGRRQPLRRVLTDSETLAQHAKERGE